MIYPEKISFIIDSEIKTFQHKQKLREKVDFQKAFMKRNNENS